MNLLIQDPLKKYNSKSIYKVDQCRTDKDTKTFSPQAAQGERRTNDGLRKWIWYNLLSYIAILLLAHTSIGLAWGGRGHASICEATVFLLKQKNLKEFLQSRPHVMAHLCNIPDIQWRQLPPEITNNGNPTHYFSPDLVGLKIDDVPWSYPALQKIIDAKLQGEAKNSSSTKKSMSRDGVGSSWWRINQFFSRIVALKDSFAKSTPPKNKVEEQDDSLPYNKNIYDMFVNMGVMGHFVADLAQPYHNTSDYDAWAVGHGGLHSFYEDICVAKMDSNLIGDIVSEAKKNVHRPFEKPESVVEKMRELSRLAFADITKLIALDAILEKSVVKIENGNEIKVPAKRLPAIQACKKFHKILMLHLGRAALALSHLWDLAYTKAGSPDLSHYRSYRYPLTVDFIRTDYLPEDLLITKEDLPNQDGLKNK